MISKAVSWWLTKPEPSNTVPSQLLGVIPSNTGGFGDVTKAAEGFHAHDPAAAGQVAGGQRAGGGGGYLHELTAEEIHRITRKVSNGDVSYNRHLALVRSILKRAEQHWGWIDKAPALILKREAKRRIRWLTEQEAGRLLEELPDHLAVMVQFSLHTGLRKSNVTGLQRSQIDMGRLLLYIDGEDFKNGNDHAIPLNDAAVEAIRSQIGKHHLHVFTYRGKPIEQTNTKAWRAALVRAGIQNFRWHDLRHTWASWMAQAGAPMHVLQELGGWESPQMLRRYAHLSREHLAEYVGRLHGTKSPTPEVERKRG